ncbi:MAG: hypothetical protein AAF500_03890 [Myxococcota bacterium]
MPSPIQFVRKVTTTLKRASKLGVGGGTRYLGLAVVDVLTPADDTASRPYLDATEQAADLTRFDVAGENREHGFAYVATPPSMLAAFIANLPSDLSEYAFVDYGSGQGRVLLLASEGGFREIIGVEFARELHEQALANVDRWAPSDDRIRCVHGDATEFAIPESPCVLYFNNPFSEPVMIQVLARIAESIQSRPRKVFVLYQQALPGLETDIADNLTLLDNSAFLEARPVTIPSLRTRARLRGYLLRVYESR